MKNSKLRNTSGDDWITPIDFYNNLNKKYNFDFDPCPYKSCFDGLAIDWGKCNFINPPYSRTLKEKFILKAFEESKKEKRVFYCFRFLRQQKFFTT